MDVRQKAWTVNGATSLACWIQSEINVCHVLFPGARFRSKKINKPRSTHAHSHSKYHGILTLSFIQEAPAFFVFHTNFYTAFFTNMLLK